MHAISRVLGRDRPARGGEGGEGRLGAPRRAGDLPEVPEVIYDGNGKTYPYRDFVDAITIEVDPRVTTVEQLEAHRLAVHAKHHPGLAVDTVRKKGTAEREAVVVASGASGESVFSATFELYVSKTFGPAGPVRKTILSAAERSEYLRSEPNVRLRAF